MCSGLFRCEACPTKEKDPLKSLKQRPTQPVLAGGRAARPSHDVVMLSEEESLTLARKSLIIGLEFFSK